MYEACGVRRVVWGSYPCLHNVPLKEEKVKKEGRKLVGMLGMGLQTSIGPLFSFPWVLYTFPIIVLEVTKCSHGQRRLGRDTDF